MLAMTMMRRSSVESAPPPAPGAEAADAGPAVGRQVAAGRRRCLIRDLNENLLCALCSGYLVNATAIIECLHTFCRSCIVRYLESSQTCPVCDVPLHDNSPLLGIRPDVTLQTLVYKLVPGVYKEELKRRHLFTVSPPAGISKSISPEMLLKDIDEVSLGRKIFTGQEQFSICLQYSASGPAADKSSGPVKDRKQGGRTDRRYLLCPAALTIRHLKKLISSKIDLTSPDEYQLDLFHSDEILDDDYTLMDVAYITAWSAVTPLQFYYTIRDTSCVTLLPGPATDTSASSSPASCSEEWSDLKRPSARRPKSVGDRRNLVKKSVKGKPFPCQRQKIRRTSPAIEAAVKNIISSLAETQQHVTVEKVPIEVNRASDEQKKSAECETTVRLETKHNGAVDLKSDGLCETPLGLTEDQKLKTVKELQNASEMETSKAVVSKLKIVKCSKSKTLFVRPVEVTAHKLNIVPRMRLPKHIRRFAKSHAKHRHHSHQTIPPKTMNTCSETTVIESIETSIVVESPASSDVSTKSDSVVRKSVNTEMSQMCNENVVSSSTSSQTPTGDDGDDEVGVSEIDGSDVSSPPIRSVRLSRGTAETSETESLMDPRAVDVTKDATTLRVPIRIVDHGQRGELLLHLPQNVSVQCSFRSDEIFIESRAASPKDVPAVECFGKKSLTVDPAAHSVAVENLPLVNKAESLKQAAVEQKHSSVEEASDVTCTEADDLGKLPSAAASVPDPLTSSTVPNSVDDSSSALSTEQPDINMFPFVTVSPSRRQVQRSNPPCSSSSTDVTSMPSSTGGWTSPLPIVSTTWVSPARVSSGTAVDMSPKHLPVLDKRSTKTEGDVGTLDSEKRHSVERNGLQPRRTSTDDMSPSMIHSVPPSPDTSCDTPISVGPAPLSPRCVFTPDEKVHRIKTDTPVMHREIIKVPVYTAVFRNPPGRASGGVALDLSATQRHATAKRRSNCCSRSRDSGPTKNCTGHMTLSTCTEPHVTLTTYTEPDNKCERLTEPSLKLTPIRDPTGKQSSSCCGSRRKSQTFSVCQQQDDSAVSTTTTTSVTGSGAMVAHKSIDMLASHTPSRLVVNLRRCDALCSQQSCCNLDGVDQPQQQQQWHRDVRQHRQQADDVQSDVRPPMKRLKLMCNGMTIYRTLDVTSLTSSRTRDRRHKTRGIKRRRFSFPGAASNVADGSQRRKRHSSASPAQHVGSKRRQSAPTASEVSDTSVSPLILQEQNCLLPKTLGSGSSDDKADDLTVIKSPTRLVLPCLPDSSAISTECEEPLELTTPEVRQRRKEKGQEWNELAAC